MSQQAVRPGPPTGRLQRRRVRGQDAHGRKRSVYVDPETDRLLSSVAERLGWSESRTLVALLHLAVLPYRGPRDGDVAAIAQRLVGLEMERVAATEG